MTQVFLTGGSAAPLSVTVQAASTISGAVASGGLIKITTPVAHGLVTGDIVQISGVTGTVEANGQWVVTVVDTTHFTLNNSTFANAYVSGGSAAHVGHATGATVVDNTVFPSGPSSRVTLVGKMHQAPQNVTSRLIFEDAEDSAFLTGMPLLSMGFAGGAVPSADERKDQTLTDLPDDRFGSSGDNLRVLLLWGAPVAGSLFKFSAWLEY